MITISAKEELLSMIGLMEEGEASKILAFVEDALMLKQETGNRAEEVEPKKFDIEMLQEIDSNH